MYRRDVYYWECVLMVQRLLLALLFTFGSSDATLRTVVSSLLCALYLALHVVVQPLRLQRTNALQTALLLCLFVVAEANVPAATDASVDGLSTVRHSTRNALFHLEMVCRHFVPATAVVAIIAGTALRRRLKSTAQRRHG
jgi:hypothetical protein